MHARGIQPASNVTVNDVEDYCATFEKKMGSFLQPRADLKDEEASKLGMKNEDDEVEKFVQVNILDLFLFLSRSKWQLLLELENKTYFKSFK
jgi:hypothetical protein